MATSDMEGANATTATSEATQSVNINRQSDSTAEDPFAAQRTADNNPFAEKTDAVAELGSSPLIQSGPLKQDRRMSKEWDAFKVPPSRFQKREGSIYATPGSRDGHVERNTQTAYHEKLKEKKWTK